MKPREKPRQGKGRFGDGEFAAGLRVLVTTGGVLSIFTGGEVSVALFPATSVTVTGLVTAEPSEPSCSGLAAGLVDATPESASAAVKGIVTFVLFQPAAFGAGIVAGPTVSSAEVAPSP